MLQSKNFHTTVELNSLSRQVLTSLPHQVALINSDGDIVAYNQKWLNKHELVNEKWAFPLLGENVLHSLQSPLAQSNDYALRFIMAYKSVLSGEVPELKVHFPIILESRKWYSLTISILEDKEHFLLLCSDISTEMSAKSALNESSVRFQRQFQNKLYGIILADEDHNVIEVNKTATQILGVSFENLKKRPLDYFLNIDLDVDKEEQVGSLGEVFLGETSINKFDGTPLPVEMNVSTYTDHKGEKFFNCTFKDISYRKKAEIRLETSEQRYREQFENSLDGIIIAEQDGAIFDANPMACSILGYSYEELVFQKREAIIDSTNPKIIEVINKRDREGFYAGEFEFIHKNGSKIQVELRNRLVTGTDGKKQSLLSFHSIDKRIKTEVKFRELFNASPNAIAVIDKNGEVTDLNNSFARVFGFSHEELLGNTLSDFILKENQKADNEMLFNRALNGEHIKIETSRINKKGEKIPLILSLTPVVEDSKITSVFSIYTDITDQIESKKIIEKQLREKEILLHEIHHRVKNNLAIISGLIGLEGIYSNNDVLNEQLKLTQSRIHTIAKIHELLYKHNDFAHIDFQEYTDEISESFSRNSSYTFESLNNQPVYLNVNQAIPCGILLHEITALIISNARKLGLNKHRISYRLTSQDNELSIHICEQGKTSTFDFIEGKYHDLGSQLISVLIKQLGATVKLEEKNETCISISFKKREKKGAHSALI